MKEKEIDQALYFLKNKNYKSAQKALIQLHHDGYEKALEMLIELYGRDQNSEILEFLKQESLKENIDAMSYLADIYFEEEKYELALNLFEILLQKKSNKSFPYLATIFLEGRGTKEDTV